MSLKNIPSVIDAVEFRRDQYGWTQTKMAKELHITQTHYSEFIHSKRSLPLIAIKYAYKIGVPAAVLLQIRSPK